MDTLMHHSLLLVVFIYLFIVYCLFVCLLFIVCLFVCFFRVIVRREHSS